MNETSYWPIVTKIDVTQRMVIVHSIIYYEMDSSVISDSEFDAMAKKLVRMREEYPEEWDKSYYRDCFVDFDGTTGFDLPGKLDVHERNWLRSIASTVLNLYRQERRS